MICFWFWNYLFENLKIVGGELVRTRAVNLSNRTIKKTTLFSEQETSRHNAYILQRETPKTPYFLCVCVCVCVETLAPEKQAVTEVTICLAKFIGAKVVFFFAINCKLKVEKLESWKLGCRICVGGAIIAKLAQPTISP